MELRQLRYFIKVAECQSFSEAARQLHITQSTLSQQIKQLEDEVKATLFLRDSHHVTLTDVGEAFLPGAQHTIMQSEACMDSIIEVTQCVKGVLNIGVTYTFSPILKETILLFIKQHPHVRLNIVSQSMSDLMEMLMRRELDVVLSYKPLQNYPQIESHFLFDNELCVVVSDTHPLAQKSSLRLKDLQHQHLALPAQGLQARNHYEQIVDHKLLDENIVLEINEVNALIQLVRDSRLVTLLSTATIAQSEGVVAVPLEGINTSMQGSYHLLRGAYTKVATKAFLQTLCETKNYGMAQMELFD